MLVVGAGETAELTARALAARGVEAVFVANRRYDRAIGLAAALRRPRRPLRGAARRRWSEADIVVASTSSPHHVIEREALAEVMAAREGRPLLLIDLAVPRDIHPDCREVAGVSLHDMDDLQALAERNASGREAEARRAEASCAPSSARFERWLASQDVTPTVAALRERADEIVDRVLAENEPRWEGAHRGRPRAPARRWRGRSRAGCCTSPPCG